MRQDIKVSWFWEMSWLQEKKAGKIWQIKSSIWNELTLVLNIEKAVKSRWDKTELETEKNNWKFKTRFTEKVWKNEKVEP